MATQGAWCCVRARSCSGVHTTAALEGVHWPTTSTTGLGQVGGCLHTVRVRRAGLVPDPGPSPSFQNLRGIQSHCAVRRIHTPDEQQGNEGCTEGRDYFRAHQY